MYLGTCYSPYVTGNEALGILIKGFTHTVKDPLWGNVPLTKELRAILDTREVDKLNRIKQNGPAFHIYPGAVHTRLSHSVGVYYLGREMMLSLARKNDELPFTEQGLMSFLSACLLHDIGHFPYAHSLKELSVREHEEIARTLILESEELSTALINAGADPLMTGLIIDTKEKTADRETLFYRSVLSGTLDPDKLDYLSRDAFFAGIPYGKQDTSYIISSLSYNEGAIVIEQDSISLVEQVLFSKYMMYRNLYWHKGVRAATAMIKKAVVSALSDEIIKLDDLYLKDDNGFTSLCFSHQDYQPFKLVESVENGELEERKAWKPYEEDGVLEKKASSILERYRTEKEIFHLLSSDYPELKEYEVIIDIPEPISFETKINIMLPDGSVRKPDEDEMLFSKAGSFFSKSLRKVALYLPSFVKDSDAEKAFQEVQRG